MRAIRQSVLVAGFVLALGMTVCADPVTNRPVRVAVKLLDGSLVLGTPRFTSIALQTSYSVLDIPLNQLKSIKAGADGGTVALTFASGDKLSGRLELRQLELDSLLGRVGLPLQVVDSVMMYAVREALPDRLDEGLVLHYSFDVDRGDKTTDASGNGRDGGVRGATWTPDGKIGGAYRFDGGDDQIKVTEWKGIVGAAPRTLSLWMRTPARERNFYMISWGKGPPFRTQCALMVLANNTPRFYMWDYTADSKIDVRNDTWHHLVGTYDGKSLRLYVDGAIQETQGASGDLAPNPVDVTIGTWAWQDALFFNGLLDEIRIYDRALSDDEVKKLYGIQP